MDTISGDATCIIDRNGIIVWASQEFLGLFSHRASPAGMSLSQLFPGLPDVCRNGLQVEDRDRYGRRRHFQVECQRVSNARGDPVSDVMVLHDVTLMRLLNDISRLATQAGTPREMFEKALLLIKDSCGYLGLAGFAVRGNEIEQVASKGWTEKLKSMIRIVPIAPDAPAMAGRCAYHRKQLVTTIEEYYLMESVKDAIERIGGEFVVATPLIDHERLAGVLVVFHGRALSQEELDTLQTICNQLAVSLDVLLREAELTGRAEDASLAVDLLSHEMALHNVIIRAWTDAPGDEKARQRALKALALNDEALLDIGGTADQGNSARHTMTLTDVVGQAIEDARLIAAQSSRKIDATVKLADGETAVGALLRYALRNLLVNSVKHSLSPSADVIVRTSSDRTGALRIEVTDNGPGVPDELKSQVFRRSEPDGRRAGLHLVKRIVNHYGGRVWIEDRVPGNPAKGARVVVMLPPETR
jgi:Signal transduction histidine kinase